MSAQKILFVLQLPPPVHGASMVNKLIYDSNFINSSFECHYINLTTAKDINDIGKGGIKKVIAMFKIWLQVINTFRKHNFDLVYITLSPHGLAFYKDGIMAILLKLMGAKVVFHLHGKGIKKQISSNYAHRYLYKLTFKNVKIIHLAPCLYEDIRMLADKKNVWFVPNGIEPVSTAPTLPKRSNKILYLSNMQESKGSLVLLKAAKILKERKVDCKIDFVGKWHTNDKFKREWTAFYESDGLVDMVKYHGPKYGDAKRTFFEEAALFVLPTFYKNECFPIAILEAMSYGLPIVSTPEGAIPDILQNGETGILTERQNPDELADKLQELLENPDLRSTFALKSMEEFKNKYTSDIFEKNMVNALRQIHKAFE